MADTQIPEPPSTTVQTSNEPPRTLWMGDLDPSFDEATIQHVWLTVGHQVQVKLIRAKKNLLIPCSTSSTLSAAHVDEERIQINGVSFIDPNTTQLHHAGYCFVQFANLQEAQAGLQLNATPLPNVLSPTTRNPTNPTGKRNFRLNWASGATLQSDIPTTPEYSLFVGDLSPTATEAHLLSLFQTKFKSVKTVRVMTDPITGASRCFGFVRFADEKERRRALAEMNGVWCQGRQLRVAYATPRNNLLQQQQAHPAPPGPPSPPVQLAESLPDSLRLLAGVPSLAQLDSASLGRAQQPLLLGAAGSLVGSNSLPLGSRQLTAGTDSTNTTVFIGGLSNMISESQLHALFMPFGNILSVKVPPGRGCGFVRFENRMDAEAAIQGMQGFIVGGNAIRLSWGRTHSHSGSSGSSGSGSSMSIDHHPYHQQLQPQQQRLAWASQQLGDGVNLRFSDTGSMAAAATAATAATGLFQSAAPQQTAIHPSLLP
ncbi:AaceriAAR151Wp [[Ashbya] aceris (nom. inval.)]|nr:AaceriAAR151Wp [[Ashbya] aceris (nom. inval.)]